MALTIGPGVTISAGVTLKGFSAGASAGGTTYSSANGDWPAGASGFSGGVSWGGGYNLEVDYATTISAAALAAFAALTAGSSIVITVSGVDYNVIVTTPNAGTNGSMSWFFVDTASPPGINIVDAITIATANTSLEGDLFTLSGTLDLETESGTEDLMA